MECHPNLAGAAPQSIRIRSVWKHNVQEEFALIRQVAPWFRIATMDTEFPGVLYPSPCHPCQMTPEQHYALLKANVDVLHLVQVGLTHTNPSGRLPELYGEPGVGNVWEFNVRGFHPRRDPHVPESVELLGAQGGMDFDALDRDGIEPHCLAQLMMSSGLLLNGSTVGWVTFHGAYNFAFLVKLLTGWKLPESLDRFMDAVRYYFGIWVLDVKCVIRRCPRVCGGLEKVARDLNVVRTVGTPHQAGSDSLLTLRIFRKILETYFPGGGIEQHAGLIYGLAAYCHNATSQ